MYSHVACDVMKERTLYLLKPSSLIWHLMPYLFLLTVSSRKCKRTCFKQTLKSELFFIISWDVFNGRTNIGIVRHASFSWSQYTIYLLIKLSFLAVLMSQQGTLTTSVTAIVYALFTYTRLLFHKKYIFVKFPWVGRRQGKGNAIFNYTYCVKNNSMLLSRHFICCFCTVYLLFYFIKTAC